MLVRLGPLWQLKRSSDPLAAKKRKGKERGAKSGKRVDRNVEKEKEKERDGKRKGEENGKFFPSPESHSLIRRWLYVSVLCIA